MYQPYCILLTGLLCCTAPVMAQTHPAQAPYAQTPVMNDAFQGGWQTTDLRNAVDLWTAIVQEVPADQQARLNQFRSMRNESLARNQGQLPAGDRSRLEEITKAMEATAPDAFETHLARYHLAFPAADAMQHLASAKARDGERMELLAPLFTEAARQGDREAMARHGRELKLRGAVAAGLWDMADDILRSVDTDGVLIAAGEMDALPIWVRQHADGLRPDVLVIDQRMLVDADYRMMVWQRSGAKGAVPKQVAGFIEKLGQTTSRPVFLSLALGPERIKPLREKVYLTGMAMRYSEQPVDNLPLLRQRWPMLSRNTTAGPLSSNYLLPGAVLLRHYRETGDEMNSALLEHELRRIANACQATPKLYQLGILEH